MKKDISENIVLPGFSDQIIIQDIQSLYWYPLSKYFSRIKKSGKSITEEDVFRAVKKVSDKNIIDGIRRSVKKLKYISENRDKKEK